MRTAGEGIAAQGGRDFHLEGWENVVVRDKGLAIPADIQANERGNGNVQEKTIPERAFKADCGSEAGELVKWRNY